MGFTEWWASETLGFEEGQVGAGNNEWGRRTPIPVTGLVTSVVTEAGLPEEVTEHRLWDQVWVGRAVRVSWCSTFPRTAPGQVQHPPRGLQGPRGWCPLPPL